MASSKNVAVFGILNERMGLERAVDELKLAGFSNNDISALLPDEHSTRDFAHEKNTKAPEGAASGAGAGVVLGGTLGWLVGAGLLAIPGVGPFVAAGPIMAALAGAGVGGAVGAVSGALIGMGLPEYEAKRYEDKLHGGRMLVSVHCNTSDEVKRAKEVLKKAGAEDVACAGEEKAPARDKETDFRIGSTRATREEVTHLL